MRHDPDLGSRYPHISFTKRWEISSRSQYLLGKCEGLVSGLTCLPVQPARRRELLEVSLVKGAQATTAIEGNTLTDSEVRQVASGDSLPTSKHYQEQEVRNILQAMNDLLTSVARDGQVPLISAEMIRQFHEAVGRELGEHLDAIPGRFREDSRVVGRYRCPRHQDVPALVDALCEWLPEQFGFQTGRQSFAEAVVQAIVTHVYLEWIHPFGDGNGRTGRLLEFYVLLRAGNPDIASHILSNHYNQTRPEYYRQLDRAGRDRDLTAFIDYAVQGYYDGLERVFWEVCQDNIETSWRFLVYSRFAAQQMTNKRVFKRRRNLVLALPMFNKLRVPELRDLSTQVARDYAAVSDRTLKRDLAYLEELHLLEEFADGSLRAKVSELGPHMSKRHVRKQAEATEAEGSNAVRDDIATTAPAHS